MTLITDPMKSYEKWGESVEIKRGHVAAKRECKLFFLYFRGFPQIVDKQIRFVFFGPRLPLES